MAQVRVCAGEDAPFTVAAPPRLLGAFLVSVKSSVYTRPRKNARPRKDRPVCAGDEGEADLVSQLSKD